MGYQNCTEEKGLIPPRDCPGIYQAFGGCGFREDHAVNLYTSPDLVSWTFKGDVYGTDSDRPEGIYFRPKVIYNANTSSYVLWINYLAPASSPLASYPSAVLVVATSKSALGPFTTVTKAAALEVSGPGDFTLFVDPRDNSAYVAYDAWGNNHQVSIEKLTDDYLNSLGVNATTGTITETGNEAPMLFERNGWYYLIFGPTCCFCNQGSGAIVLWAEHPLGPWT